MLVEVQVKVPGHGRDELPVARIAVDGELTAGELIDLAVGEQIRLLAADGERCRAALDRQYLSPQDVQAQSRTGVVRLFHEADLSDAGTISLSHLDSGFAPVAGPPTGRTSPELRDAVAAKP